MAASRVSSPWSAVLFPWLLLENEDMPHVGTLDIDIALNGAALKDDDEYKAVHGEFVNSRANGVVRAVL